MTGTRLRQVKLSWWPNGGGQTLIYNDRPAVLEMERSAEELERELLANGWIFESAGENKGKKERLFRRREAAEPEPAAPYELVFTTNPGVTGATAREFRGAVAIHGEWAACSTPDGDGLVELFQLTPSGWAFSSRLQSQYHADTTWLPALLFHQDVLLVATPFDKAVLRFERQKDGWKQLDSMQSELVDFGRSLAADGELVAVSGNLGGRYITVLRSEGVGPLDVETRIGSRTGGNAEAIGLSGDWLAVGTTTKTDKGEVHVFRCVNGVWKFQQTLAQPAEKFGAAVSILGERLLVVTGAGRGTKPAAHWYRLGDSQWRHESTLTLPGLDGEPFVNWFGDTVAIGFPYCHGATGQVLILRVQGNKWKVAQAITPLEARIGDRFGESISMDGTHLMIGAQGAVAGGGCGYIFRRRA
jgi:hypothetical protein